MRHRWHSFPPFPEFPRVSPFALSRISALLMRFEVAAAVIHCGYRPVLKDMLLLSIASSHSHFVLLFVGSKVCEIRLCVP